MRHIFGRVKRYGVTARGGYAGTLKRDGCDGGVDQVSMGYGGSQSGIDRAIWGYMNDATTKTGNMDQVVQAIRFALGHDSTASDGILISMVSDECRASHEQARFAIDSMLEDGGLVRDARGWLYCPRPAQD